MKHQLHYYRFGVILLFLFSFCLKTYGQSAEIRPNQGISVPQFTTAFINALTTQPKGTVVFDKDLNVMKYWTGSVWQSLGAGAGTGWTASGSDIVNSNTGNVGIGTSNPVETKMVVNSASTSNTNAVFGSNGTGISLQKNWPTIGFNQYRDAANVQRYIGTGYAMGNFMDPTTGTMYWNAISTGTAGTVTPAETPTMKLSQSGALAPQSLEAPSTGLYAFGGKDISPIVTNTSDDGTLRVNSTSSGIFLLGNSFLAIDRNSIQARGSNFIGGTFSKFEKDLKLNPWGGKVGINSGNINLTANLEVYRSPTSNAGSAVFKGTTHYSHFHFGNNEDTYIRGGKDNSKVIINDIPNGAVDIAPSGGNVTIGGYTTLNNDLVSPSTGSLNLVPIGIFSFNITYDNIVSNSGNVTNLAGNIATGGWSASAGYGVDDDINFSINLNTAITNTFSSIIVIGDSGFRGPNYVSKAVLSNDKSNVYCNYTVDNIIGRSITSNGRVVVYGIR